MFSHLHVHTQYSLLEASCVPKKLAQKAVDLNMPAVAITDYGNMFGAVEHYFACESAGVKPIVGLDVFIAPGSRFDKGLRSDGGRLANRKLVLLAQDIEGYRNLCAISSIGYQEGFYYKPRVDYETLAKYSKNIIALSGGAYGEVPWTYLNKGKDEALEKIQQFQKIYGDRFYLEMNKTGVKQWDTINPFLQEVSGDLGIKLVATNDVHYMVQEDQIAQEVLICIGSNRTLQDESRFRLGSDQFYLKSPDQMRDLFSDVPEACDNTLEITERCNVKFKIKDDKGNPIYHLPTYPTVGGVSLKDEMRRVSREGLEERFREFQEVGDPLTDEAKEKYVERLDYELGVIDGMGFNGYFLIVQDFIGWSKENDIPVGPGRGSGAGSLVAYSLKITDLDPIPYNLIFERFLNPERVSMPDFDIDFCQEGRGRVIDYVTEKYTQESVSQIITYGKLQTRAAIRDVGRVMGMTYGDVDVVSKLIPDVLGISLEEAIETEPRLQELMDNDPRIQTLMDLARKVEGLVRHAGIHAAGVIIADGNIVSHAPLYRGSDGENVVQYDMKHAEKMGLIKFDFLGLKTLTHINEAFKHIEKNRGKKLTPLNISLSDPGIYEILSEGDTNGIFQFESEGITDLIIKSRPDCFEDIVAITALYRPGPMEMIPDYLKRKKGQSKVKYAFPELEPILKETYGIVVYQEHVQLIAAKIASYSLGEADMLRRAMGKKIHEEMVKQKKRFVDGAVANGYDEKKSGILFDTMAEFAKYGFNKSHAAAYCVISAQTAWLKRYYPVEFFAALLSTDMNDTDKVVKYVKDAQNHDIEVLSPHINGSGFKFSVKEDVIFFSLGAIKGVGQAAVEAILEAREAKPNKKFESLEEFFESVDLRRVNKKTIECLIKSGGFDGFGHNRAELMDDYTKFVENADRVKKDKEVGQVSLFSLSADITQAEKVVIKKREPWTRSARLAYEKEVLGFYLSDHPLKGFEHFAKNWHLDEVKNLDKKEKKDKTQVLGMVSAIREIITKKGTRMAFAQFEDLTGQVELVIFPDTYAKIEHKLKMEGIVVLSGLIDVDKKNGTQPKILVDDVRFIREQFRQSKRVIVRLDAKDQNENQKKLSLLKELFAKNQGATKVTFNYLLKDIAKEVDLKLMDPDGVELSSEVIDSIYNSFGSTEFIELY
jgi:DNA polymerase III subunit alpha